MPMRSIRGWLVILKQHRFEVLAGIVLAGLIGAWAMSVRLQLDGLGVPAECVDNWLGHAELGEVRDAACHGPMRAYGGILGGAGSMLVGEGFLPWSAMGLLPFAIGLLGGTPLVAAELEARTASTAWTLCPSRTRWLLRVALPVAIVLGIGAAIAAVAASGVVDAMVEWGHSAFYYVGLHGSLALVRAFAAFGIGILFGAVIGRTLPALAVGAAVSVVVLFGVAAAREAWLGTLEARPIARISSVTGELVMEPRAETTDWGWIAPDGELFPLQDALTLVPREIYESDDRIQFIDSSTWLVERGYSSMPLGVTQETAMGWQPLEGMLFGSLGAALLGATVVVVNRRRPG